MVCGYLVFSVVLVLMAAGAETVVVQLRVVLLMVMLYSQKTLHRMIIIQ